MPGNIAELFAQHLHRREARLYRHFAGDAWRDVTVAELAALVARWQEAFRRAGCVPGDRVVVCARNGVTWVAIDLAALGLGLVVVPLFVDDSPDNVAWCVDHADAKLLLVETARLAATLSGRRDGMGAPPLLVVLRHVAAAAPLAGALPLSAFLPETGGEPEIRALPDDALATICYTSGTAGRPKGVMLSHGNILANVRACAQTGMARSDDRFLSMLPLSHMFERTGGYYLPLSLGAQVVFARGIAQLADDLATQAPTIVFAVPRIFERLSARIDQALADSFFKRKLFAQCVERGARVTLGGANALDTLLAPLLRTIVAKPVLAKLGGRLRLAVVGGAPLDPAIARRFIGLGLVVLQGYGMTEASPVVSVNRDDDNDPESVGLPLPGIEVRVAANAELLVRGPGVMQGYWRNEGATRTAIDTEGWLHTGDLGEIRAGRVYIRGRLKDVIVMSNGEKVSPEDVELAILHDPVFEQVMLVGEGRSFLSLVALTQATDEKALARRANDQLRLFPRWVRVRRVVAVGEPWSVDNGLLTPTLKLKRPRVLARYKDRIDAAYAAASSD